MEGKKKCSWFLMFLIWLRFAVRFVCGLVLQLWFLYDCSYDFDEFWYGFTYDFDVGQKCDFPCSTWLAWFTCRAVSVSFSEANRQSAKKSLPALNHIKLISESYQNRMTNVLNPYQNHIKGINTREKLTKSLLFPFSKSTHWEPRKSRIKTISRR